MCGKSGFHWYSQQYNSNWFSRRPARPRLSNNCRNHLHTFEVLAMLHHDPLLDVVVDGGQPCDPQSRESTRSEAEAEPTPTPTDVVSAPLDAFISTIAIWIFESIIIDFIMQFYGKWWLMRWCCCGVDWGESRKLLVVFSAWGCSRHTSLSTHSVWLDDTLKLQLFCIQNRNQFVVE